jgi:hypothetical protein
MEESTNNEARKRDAALSEKRIARQMGLDAGAHCGVAHNFSLRCAIQGLDHDVAEPSWCERSVVD